jgi:type IV pilus assembly protein PilX
MGMTVMSSVRFSASRPVHNERGAALVTSLVLLLVLTVIGITAMMMTRMQERMAGNTRDLNLAFQGAEAALRDGESMIRALPESKADLCSTAGCQFWAPNVALIANPETHDFAWWKTNGVQYESAGGNHATPKKDMVQLADDPVLFVQYITRVPDSLTIGEGTGAPPGRDFYLVSGGSNGGSGQANTVVQSTFARR